MEILNNFVILSLKSNSNLIVYINMFINKYNL